MNLDHEFGKITESLDNKIITEDTFLYECHKLNCVAAKYDINWKTKINGNPARMVTQEMVNADFDELHNLFQNRLLKESYFVRDLKKIIAVCEDLKLNFPGPPSYREYININHISSLIVENEIDDLGDDDMYDDLGDEDEFEDEEESEPQLMRAGEINGHSVEEWSSNSETEYRVDGNVVGDVFGIFDEYLEQVVLSDFEENAAEIKANYIARYTNGINEYQGQLAKLEQTPVGTDWHNSPDRIKNMINGTKQEIMRYSSMLKAVEAANTPEELYRSLSEEQRDNLKSIAFEDSLDDV